MLYIICGLPGSGKTTFSKKLAQEKHAIRFTLDEWVIALFGTGYPTKQYSVYEKRCIDLITSVAEQLLQLDINVILDFGFFKKKDRNRYKTLAKKYKTKAKIYYLDTNYKILESRVRKRNKNKKTANHNISVPLLKKFIREFEKPSRKEADYVKTIKVKKSAQ